MNEIGILLKEARESKGLEIKDAAKALKIRPYYIEILESGDVSSVSNEIYINGYLKSYANWLGIGSNKIASRLKSGSNTVSNVNKFTVADKARFSISLSIPLPEKSKKESSSFFSFDDKLVSAGALVTLVTLLLSVIIYVIWHKNHDVTIRPAFDFASVRQVTSGGRNWAEGLEKKGDKFLLVAQDAVTLKIKENGGEFINKQLEVGEIYFLSVGSGVIVETDNPDSIDVMIDDGKGTSLGSLSKLSGGESPLNEGENKEKAE
jgi:transcriptional regulator with XRE-family HTH domain